MTLHTPSIPASDLPSEEQVLAFLQAHPDFLPAQEGVIARLLADHMPDRDLGTGVVDFQGHALRALRTEITELRQEAQELIRTARDNMSLQHRVHGAALALMAAETVEDGAKALAEDLPLLLEVDLVLLCLEPGAPEGLARISQPLPEGTVDALLGGSDTRLRAHLHDETMLYGEGAGLIESDALVRLPATDSHPVGLLAFGSRRARTFEPGQGTELMSFLSAVLHHSLRHWKE